MCGFAKPAGAGVEFWRPFGSRRLDFTLGAGPTIWPLITPRQIIYHYRKSKLRILNQEVMLTITSIPLFDRLRHSEGFPAGFAEQVCHRAYLLLRHPRA
ncbi:MULTISPECIES: hypothetical protein [unclassified Rhizobium]|uniref:hypothetical protein n=1 Tax=unclassified Rhizobium TaxID=2613769 RepID=UPI0007F0F084|nr:MULTISPECIES: hypothetical protein [unclassified Rhizobium]ANK84765.1 hypothetical protein AMK02_CH01133 [Rhizobium sp. N731]ANL15013.1 hypothetical protein AMJ97_CH01133 [Rhizobium sp. N1314]